MIQCAFIAQTHHFVIVAYRDIILIALEFVQLVILFQVDAFSAIQLTACNVLRGIT